MRNPGPFTPEKRAWVIEQYNSGKMTIAEVTRWLKKNVDYCAPDIYKSNLEYAKLILNLD